jgi:hypothetical protein
MTLRHAIFQPGHQVFGISHDRPPSQCLFLRIRKVLGCYQLVDWPGGVPLEKYPLTPTIGSPFADARPPLWRHIGPAMSVGHTGATERAFGYDSDGMLADWDLPPDPRVRARSVVGGGHRAWGVLDLRRE